MLKGLLATKDVSLLHESKKVRCKSLQIDSLNQEYDANINSVIAGLSSSVSIFGVPVGAIAAIPSTGIAIHVYAKKLDADINYIEQQCDEIPFDEIKEILGERFEQVDKTLDRNYGAVKRNLEKIRRNYQAIKHVKDKVDKNLVA